MLVRELAARSLAHFTVCKIYSLGTALLKISIAARERLDVSPTAGLATKLSFGFQREALRLSLQARLLALKCRRHEAPKFDGEMLGVLVEEDLRRRCWE